MEEGGAPIGRQGRRMGFRLRDRRRRLASWMREGADDDDVSSRMRLVFLCPTFLEYNRTLGLSSPVIVSSVYV